MSEVKISRGYTLLVYGPAKVRIEEGAGRIFGARIEAGQEIIAEPTKALPVYAVEDLRLKVETGTFSFYPGDTIPKEWYETAELLKNRENRRILIVGDIDSGKTSLATLIVNTLVSSGDKVAVIDADVGQKSIGPPGTVGLGITETEVYSLSNIPMLDAFFIGSNTPAGIIHRSISGVAALTRKGEKVADRLVIDTTGWVTEHEGRELKFFKTLLVEPDVVLLVGGSTQLAQVARVLELFSRILRVPKPPVVYGRDKTDRREYRKYVYSKYLAQAAVKSIPLEKTRFAYSFFTGGYPLQSNEVARLQSLLGVEVYWAERADDYLGAVVASQPIQQSIELVKNLFSVRHVRILTGYELIHSVVGFMSKSRYCEGIGVITGFKPREKIINVLTNVENLEDKLWLFSTQKINPSTYEEEAGLEKWSV
ncbi:MAG: Clp1/GlmU family protein [Infirmifilum sp.]